MWWDYSCGRKKVVVDRRVLFLLILHDSETAPAGFPKYLGKGRATSTFKDRGSDPKEFRSGWRWWGRRLLHTSTAIGRKTWIKNVDVIFNDSTYEYLLISSPNGSCHDQRASLALGECCPESIVSVSSRNWEKQYALPTEILPSLGGSQTLEVEVEAQRSDSSNINKMKPTRQWLKIPSTISKNKVISYSLGTSFTRRGGERLKFVEYWPVPTLQPQPA